MQTFCQPFLLYSACKAVSYLFLSPANSVSSASFYPQADRLPAMFLVDLPAFASLCNLLVQRTDYRQPLPPDCLLPPILNAITLTHFWHKQFLDQARPGLSHLIRNVCQALDFLLSFLFFLRLRSPLSFASECVCVCVYVLCRFFSFVPWLLFFLFFCICIGSAISAIPTLVNWAKAFFQRASNARL